MYAISYIEINICCLIIMVVILQRHRRSLDKSLTSNTLTELLISAMVYVFFDMICGLQQNHVLHLSQAASTFVNSAFYISSFSVTHLAFAFSECELERPWVRDEKKRNISLIPALLLTIMTLCTLKWKFFFYVDKNGMYQKGPWYAVAILLVYGYIIMIGIRVIWMFPQKKYYALRGKMIMVSSFVLFPIMAGIIQVFFPGISIVCFGLTISMIQVFSKFLENRITMDALTQINNRTKLMQYLEQHLENRPKTGGKELYFIMIDLNDFKAINDTYGHVEGDHALVIMAETLKKSMVAYQGILARYGGDEFCIAGEFTEEEKDNLCKKIFETLKNANENSGKAYSVEMYMGWAKLTDDIETIPDLINKADAELYDQKSRKILYRKVG